MERNCFAISVETQLARGTRPLWFSFIAIAALGCGTGDTGPASASGSSGGTSGGDASGCSAGELVTLATNQHPNSLATDATNVYWTNADNGDVMTVAKSGGAPTVVASREGYGADVAADDVNVYWSVHGSGGSPIFATPKAGGTTKQLATSGYLTGLAIDQERVYWSDSSGHMMSVPKTGGEPTTLATDSVDSYSVAGWRAFALDEDRVYWSSFSTYTIGSVSKLGGEPLILFPGYVIAFAVDDTRLYFSTPAGENAGDLLAMPKTGGTPAPLFPGNQVLQVGAVAVDASCCYWTLKDNFGKHHFVAAPKGGGEPFTIAYLKAEFSLVAADSSGVYWTDWQGGTVSMLAK